jgi:hypothetical protein
VERGGSDANVMLYWPQRDVRKEGLGTYRVEVTAEYEGDGFIEFRKGKDVLHREPFQPESYVTERALPASVLEALRRGRTIEWGVYYESRRKKPVTAEFKVVDGRKFARRLAKLQRRRVYLRATPLEREMSKIDLLRNYRLYSEALTSSLGVLNTWPETQLPFKAIAACLERLKLEDTMLYAAVARRLRGAKSRFAGRSGLGAVATPASTPLPPSLVAPRVPTGADSGGGMRPGGMGVTPTPEAQKREPGPIESDEDGAAPAPEGLPVDPQGSRSSDGVRAGRVQELERQIEQARHELEAQAVAQRAAQQAEQAAGEARDALEKANESVEEARKKLADAQGAGDAAAVAAAQKAVEEAQKAHQQADADFQSAEERKNAADRELARALENAGDAQERVDRLQAALEQARNAPATVPGASGNPGVPANPAGRSALPTRQEAQDALSRARSDVERAQSTMKDAIERAGQANADLDSARQALETAQNDHSALDAAAQARAAAEASGDQAALDAAQKQLEDATKAHDQAVNDALQAVQGAENRKARAEMEAARAGATAQAAEEQAAQAQQTLDDVLKQPDDGVK